MLVTHSLQPSDDPIAAKHNYSGSHWTNNYPVTSKRLHNKCILDGLSVDSHDQGCKNDELLSTSNSGKLMLQLIDSSMMFEDKLPSVLFQSMLHVFVGTLFVLQIKRFPEGSPPQGKKMNKCFHLIHSIYQQTRIYNRLRGTKTCRNKIQLQQATTHTNTIHRQHPNQTTNTKTNPSANANTSTNTSTNTSINTNTHKQKRKHKHRHKHKHKHKHEHKHKHKHPLLPLSL